MKFLRLLLILCLVNPCYGALTFGAATGDVDSVTAATNINTLSSKTMCMWHRPTTQTANRRFVAKGSTASGQWAVRWDSVDSNDIFFDVARATVNASATSAMNFGTGSWLFQCFSYSEANGPKIFSGNLTTEIAEVTYAASPTVGSGATTDDSGGALTIGNRPGVNTAYQGDIGIFMMFNTELSVGQMRDLQWYPRPLSSCVVFHILGYTGTTTQADLSGTGNSGALTGVSIASHVPVIALTAELQNGFPSLTSTR